MTHLNDHQIRSLIDQEAQAAEVERAHHHLEACSECRQRYDQVEQRARWVESHFVKTAISESDTTLAADQAYRRFLNKRNLQVKEPNLLQPLIGSKNLRPVLGGAIALILILGLLAIPSVRAVANDFLGLFRVQQIAVIEIDPQNLPEQLGTSNVLEDLISQNVAVENFGEPQELSERGLAVSQAGFPARFPVQAPAGQGYRLQPGSQVTFEVDLQQIEQLMRELRLADLTFPKNIDGAEVVLTLQTSLMTTYGNCQLDEMFNAQGDPTEIRFEDCMILAQTPSPTISAPEGLNLPEIGKGFLQVMGLSADEAEEFSRTVDWTSTLVIPIPQYGSSYQTVSVDGVEGTLIIQEFLDDEPNFLLIWVKDGIVYSITGNGNSQEAIALANSLN